jgi:hypothetical protein
VRASRLVILASLAGLVVACALAAPPNPSSPGGPPPAERVLTASILKEPDFLAAQAPIPNQNASEFYTRMFNAFLDLYDDRGKPQPYLAEALPVLNTESWTVFPDGRMETRYQLRPNLVWHDGAARRPRRSRPGASGGTWPRRCRSRCWWRHRGPCDRRAGGCRAPRSAASCASLVNKISLVRRLRTGPGAGLPSCNDPGRTARS